MSVEQTLFDHAAALAAKRYPKGWGGAAALRLATGDILTSIAPDTELEALALCMEVGAILEAHKRDVPVTHSLCLARDDEAQPFKILSPCGICQERLRFWGPQVQVAVSTPGSALLFKPLSALQPYSWRTAYPELP